MKIAVIGGHCLDIDLIGGLTGLMSREQESLAVFDVPQDDWLMSGGGAANIAMILASLEQDVLAVGLWNEYHFASRELIRIFRAKKIGYAWMKEGHGTPVFLKCYQRSGNHTYRINHSMPSPDKEMEQKLCAAIKGMCKRAVTSPDFAIIADYDETGKGVLTDAVLEAIDEHIKCPKIGISRQRLKRLKGYDYLILDQEELAIQTGDANVDTANRILELFKATNAKNIILTLSGAGACLYDPGGEERYAHSKHLRGKIDTCGCGDVFAAGFIAFLAKGYDEVHAMQIGNAAGRAQAVKLYGARDITLDDIDVAYRQIYGRNYERDSKATE